MTPDWVTAQRILYGALLYLLSTRDKRVKGNKLAPETIIWNLLKQT